MKKVLVLFGTRPEVIKLAPVINELRSRGDQFQTAVCSTGQHSEMLYQAINQFDLEIDYDLRLMKKGQTLSGLTSSLMAKLPNVFEDYAPDIVLVQGDTTTAFVGSLIGYYHKVEVGHVEAGLRTEDKYAPFPEEMNRRLAGVLADHHFAPTKKAQQSLLNEGVTPSRVVITGNTIIDALLLTLQKNNASPPPMGSLSSVLENDKKNILVTGHRRENFGEGFLSICKAIMRLARTFEDINFIYPVHLNPNVQEPVYSMLNGINNIYLVEPVNYDSFVWLMSKSHIILTDSGGVQEEAPSIGKPVLVMREVTERPESVEAGTSILVGTDENRIFNEMSRLIVNDDEWTKMSCIDNPYGDGKSSVRIVDYLEGC